MILFNEIFAEFFFFFLIAIAAHFIYCLQIWSKRNIAYEQLTSLLVTLPVDQLFVYVSNESRHTESERKSSLCKLLEK